MTNGDMGDEKITVNGLVSDYEHGKRQRQPSRVLAGYELEGLPVRTWNKPLTLQIVLFHSNFIYSSEVFHVPDFRMNR